MGEDINVVSVNLIRYGKNVLIAACDADLLGKIIKSGNVSFEVHEEFYGGSFVSLDEAIKMIQMGTIVNLIGESVVTKAIKEGLVHQNSIIYVAGIPHVQLVR